MLWILLVIIVVAVVAYKFRVPLLAKILGQSTSGSSGPSSAASAEPSPSVAVVGPRGRPEE